MQDIERQTREYVSSPFGNLPMENELPLCIERLSCFTAIDAFVEAPSSGRGLVVAGDSGSGKTTLLAAWAARYRQAHPDSFVFEHYFGATPDDVSMPRFLTKLLGELKRLAKEIKEDIPSDPKKMAELLPLWLAQADGKLPCIVLVLDGLNQIQGEASECNLLWLPNYFPPQIRVIASALPGLPLVTLKQRGWHELLLPLLNEAERAKMVDVFFGHHGMKLSQMSRQQIVTAPGAANPLFLHTVLEELRHLGDCDHLPDKVQEYLQVATPFELFRLVIKRWQTDFHDDRDVVNRSLRYLWAARMGLSDAEWLELLADKHGPMDIQKVRPLYLALASHLKQRNGMLTFAHDFLRQAVEAELLPDLSAKEQTHLALADYFDTQLTGPRKVLELPYQLREAGQRERLAACLLDIPFFLIIQKREENVLLDYWIWLKQEQTMGQPYLKAFEQWAANRIDSEEIASVANSVALFLKRSGFHKEVEPLYRRVLQIREQSREEGNPEISSALRNLAIQLFYSNLPEEAEALYQRILQIYKLSDFTDYCNANRSMNNLAFIFRFAGRMSEAEQMLRQALQIREQSCGKNHLETVLDMNNLALFLENTGRPSEAEPLFREALAIIELNLGSNHPEVAVWKCNLAAQLCSTGRLSEAEPLYRWVIQIYELKYGPEHQDVAGTMNLLAELLIKSNRLTEAEQLYRRSFNILLQLSRAALYPHSLLNTTINSYIYLLKQMGRNAKEIEFTLHELAPDQFRDQSGENRAEMLDLRQNVLSLNLS